MLLDISAGPAVHTLRRRLERQAPVRAAPPPAGVTSGRWATALHESGHAVVAAAIGGTVTRLVLHPDGVGGRCEAGLPWSTSLRDRVAFALGGAVAESSLAGRRSLDACISAVDRHAAEAELRGHKRPDAVRTAGRHLAAATLRRNQSTVLRVARALAHRGTLDAERLRALLQNVTTPFER